MYSHGLLGVCRWRERKQAPGCLFSQGNESHHECSILTTSSKPPKDPQLQIPSHEVGLQHMNFKCNTIRSTALAFHTSHPFCIKDALIPRKQPSSLKLFLHHLYKVKSSKFYLKIIEVTCVGDLSYDSS